MRFIWRAAAVALAILIANAFSYAASPVTAQQTQAMSADGYSCEMCYDIGAGSHEFRNVECNVLFAGWCADCHSFNACHHSISTQGPCTDWHWSCGRTASEFDLDLADQRAVSVWRQLTRLAAAGDIAALKRASETDSNILYNESRGLLQRIGCKGGIVAQVPIMTSRVVVGFDNAAQVSWMAPELPGL